MGSAMSKKRWLGALACTAGVLGALPAAAPANVQVGSSGWQWGNPLPQGNTLRAMAFAGARGYAAGDFGTLLSTADGGITWSGLPAGTFSGFTEIQAIDPDSVVAGGGCAARRSDDGGRTFARIAFTPVETACREPLAALHFTTERNGYFALADGTVLQTSDGGIEFAQKTAIPGTRAAGGGPGGPPTQIVPTDLFFTADVAGFAATSSGRIYRTIDGGNSWVVASDTNRAVRSITFVTATDGYAVGDGGLFLRTADGGATWTPRAVGAPAAGANLTSIRCGTATLCLITTASGSQLVRTADGGTTFTLVTPSSDPVLTAGFASATRVVAGGGAGATVVSDDAGQTFTPIGGRLAGRFGAVRAGLVGGSAFAPGADGALAKTLDGGRTWTRSNVSTSEDVLDVAFPTQLAGFALDVAGGLFRTSDGGAHWKTLDTGTTSQPSAVHAAGARDVLLVGPRGVRRSTDGGDTFSAVRGKAVARTQLFGVDRAGSSAIVAFGYGNIIRTLDKGRTWTAVHNPGRFRRVRGRLVSTTGVRDADFVDARTGYVLDFQGRIWRTSNGGRSWSERPAAATERATAIAFSSARSGYLVIDRFGDVPGRAGFLLRTTDGGETWHPQFVVSSPIAPGGIAAPGGGTDYLLGGTSALLASTTGGDAGAASTLSITTKRRRFARRAHITVTGRLSPALGNERVVVSYRRPGSTRWIHQPVRTAANGAYTSSWDVVKGTNQFVAQWQGDFRSRGDGSPVLTVAVGPRRR
jgi:photosystem II stability/assembly factor-like uncharacterized protein